VLRAMAEHALVAFAEEAALPRPKTPDRTATMALGDGKIILGAGRDIDIQEEGAAGYCTGEQ
jgi:uncharacterized membrane protein